MEFRDPKTALVLDSDFSGGSAGAILKVGRDAYSVDYQREALPAWFQELLDTHFDGKGVPKEYRFCVRVRNLGPKARRITARFLTSPKGRNYLAPPWWLRERCGWRWLPPQDLLVGDAREFIQASLTVEPQEEVLVASAPFEAPEDVDRRAGELARHSAIWAHRTIGATSHGRPIAALETAPRSLRLLVTATAQAAEPVSWGILHVAHWLTIPVASTRRQLENVQFCLVPVTNPDGAAEGWSVTNGVGQVPKFSLREVVETGDGPAEALALWEYLCQQRPDVWLEVHAHHRWGDFWRTVGTTVNASLPAELREKAACVEAAIRASFPEALPENGMSMIDYRRPEHAIYGDQYANRLGSLRVFLQSVPHTIEAHSADVQAMVETVAEALIGWRYSVSQRGAAD